MPAIWPMAPKPKIMKNIYLLPALLILVACNTQQSQNGSPTENDTTVAKTAPNTVNHPLQVSQKIYRRIQSIIDTTPEFKQAQHIIDSATLHKAHVSFRVSPTENQADSVFTVAVGHSGNDRFEQFFTWQVDIKTRTITCVDPISGQTLSLAEYRRRNKENGFLW